MAPANVASTSKPKRKRQRKRQAASSDSSSSSSSDSSSDGETPLPVPVKLPTPVRSGESSSEASSDSSDSSSSEEETRGRRGKGKGKGKAKINAASTSNGAGATATNGRNEPGAVLGGRRPYPSRSPSPSAFNPANIPLGLNQFPLLKSLNAGPILRNHVPGDAGFVPGSNSNKKEGEEKEVEGAEKEVDKEGEKKQQEALLKESKFGDWWRARLVSEFEKELGSLASEPGLTPPRLSLLLTSLTTLSSLHTTSSSLAKSSQSIWLHDPSTAIDPLASLELEEGGEDWGKATIGGEGDVEVGAEGVEMDKPEEDTVMN